MISSFETRILVTHSLAVLPDVDQIVVISDGSIVQSGSFSQLMTSDGLFTRVLKTHLTAKDISDGSTVQQRNKEPSQTQGELGETPSNSLAVNTKIISEEETKVGWVSMEVYKVYLKALGMAPCLVTLTVYMLYHGVYMYGNIWLSQWTEDPVLKNTSSSGPEGHASRDDARGDVAGRWRRTMYYLTGYTLLGLLQAALIMTYTITQGQVLISAARTLHKDLLMNVLRCPMSFFDTTPICRIIARFSSDLATLDSELAGTIDDCLSCMCNVVGGVFMICYISPTALVVVIPMFFLYTAYQGRYMSTSRQLRRLSFKSRTPVLSFFAEAVTGSKIIRAFRSRDTFTETCNTKIDNHTKMDFHSYACDRWLGLRMSFLGNLILTSAIMMLCGGGGVGVVTGGSIGLTVSFSVEVGSELIWFIINSTRLDQHSVSVERILQYTNTPTEVDIYDKHPFPPSDWPKEWAIEFKGIGLRYRDELELVLKDITFKVKPGEKIGIVGRTGAGKSSLMLSLFRIVEPAEGTIYVDDLDICQLGLHELRSKLAIIPQDPVLFSGSLRVNLDPEGEYTDECIWSALQHTGLKEVVENLPGQLMSDSGDGGGNFSVGERQLLCLTRTVLRRTRILILDEATAAVDMATDDVIQKTIRREFKHCTVLTIAHRISTVLDYDRIMVLDNGCIKEFDTPDRLLKNTSGIYFQLLQSAGIVS